MLKNEVTITDLVQTRDLLLAKIQPLITELGATVLDNKPLEIHYPVVEYPSKITSLNFGKTPEITGVLQGIKGQYLLLDCGVLNIRKFGSYNITLSY
jgi:hypothetical protein